MKKCMLLAISASLTASSVLAGGIKEPEPDPVVMEPVAPAPVWTGAYAGGQVGFGNFEQDIFEGSGLLGGVHVGYMHQFDGGFVLGGEVDYDFTDVELSSQDGPYTVDSIARLKLRGGFASGETLFYGTGGVAKAEVDKFLNSYSPHGQFIGAGVSRLVGESGIVSGEVLYHDFDDFDGSGELTGTTATVRYSFRF
ncbi:MAG: porin family protein [Sediminimonas qiaohouensis]|uniref:Porin family protein n=2 Tax=Sediminimonas qiaohouensis TaxID=552061 RepID=A0A7C9HPD0_9RHOB|nr:porin family protein [Sediminimonas qiaohouensis]